MGLELGTDVFQAGAKREGGSYVLSSYLLHEVPQEVLKKEVKERGETL